MRHVDDGTLHAWLDAELPDAETAAVASHLDGCARCRARLDDARAMRDQAGSLLEIVEPAVDIPAFDQVRARAGLTGADGRAGHGAGDTGARRRMVLVAGWAASLALAAGIGWMARDWTASSEAPQMLALSDGSTVPGVLQPVRGAIERRESSPGDAADEPGSRPLQTASDPAREVASARAAAAPSPSAPALAPATDAAPPSGAAAGGGRDGAVPPPEPQESDAAPPAVPPASGRLSVDSMELQPPAAVQAAPPPSPQAPAEPVAPHPEGPATAAGDALPAPRVLGLEELPPSAIGQPAPGAGTARFLGLPLAGDAPAGGAGAFVNWQPMARTEAAVRTGMALYGLPDADPVETAIDPDATQVRTRYQLDSGDVVVLVQTRDAPMPAVGRVQTAATGAPPLFRSADSTRRLWTGVRGEMRLMLEVETGDLAPGDLAARLRID